MTNSTRTRKTCEATSSSTKPDYKFAQETTDWQPLRLYGQESECRQHTDRRSQPSKGFYVLKVSHNNYHNILPLVGDDATCTTTDCTQNKIPTDSKRKRETKTHPTNVQEDHSTKTETSYHKKNLSKRNINIRPLSATLQIDRRNKTLYVPLQFRDYENYGLLDTGAIQSAMSENELRRILQANPDAQLEEYRAPDFKVQIANCKWKYRTSTKANPSPVLYCGESVRGDIHDFAYNGQYPDWNVLLQKLLCDPGARKQHCKIPTDYRLPSNSNHQLGNSNYKFWSSGYHRRQRSHPDNKSSFPW